MSKQTLPRHQLEKALLDSSNLIQNRKVERFRAVKQKPMAGFSPMAARSQSVSLQDRQLRPLDDNVKVFSLILKMKLNQQELFVVVALMNSLKNSFVDLSKIS
ncbi:MAG TPA: hypothetical protein DD473_00525 [Planctomycetaceae bacterium]|nr:hypothetical protein [Planctomycetaceae bacterium]